MATAKRAASRKSTRNGLQNLKQNDFTLLLFEALDGRHYTLDGVSGVLRHKTISARYPYPHVDHTLSHMADAKGKRSPKYIELRDKLRDDWSTDLTNSDRLIDIAMRLGVDVDGLLRQSKRGA